MNNFDSAQLKEMKANLLVAVELMDVGIQLMRQNIVRQIPGASNEHIDSELKRWLMEQPVNFIPRMPANS